MHIGIRELRSDLASAVRRVDGWGLEMAGRLTIAGHEEPLTFSLDASHSAGVLTLRATTVVDRRVNKMTWEPENTPEQVDSWKRIWRFLDRTLATAAPSVTEPASATSLFSRRFHSVWRANPRGARRPDVPDP